MITELPKDARQCSLSGVFITPDARVFKAGKNGFREVTVKADKKGPGKFYNSAEKKYYSLTQAYAEAFVPNGEQKPLAFIKDASHGLDPANIMWATNDEWREYWKEHAERKCKCCGKLVEKDMAGELCKGCFTKMSNAKPDTDEIKRFQERVAATGFDPNRDFFSGRQRDALKDFKSKDKNGIYNMQGAATVIDNSTGKVIACVGGRSQNSSYYSLNRAFQAYQQPGSTIKPLIVYTPALQKGYTPDIIINTIVKKCLIQRLLMMDFMKQIMDLVMHLVQQKKLLHPELYLAHTVANRRIYGIS